MCVFATDTMTLGIAATLSAIGALVVFLSVQAVPVSRAVRLRNALLLERSRPEDFTWLPPHIPSDFKVESGEPSSEFRAIVDSLGVRELRRDWDVAIVLASHLIERAGDKGPVREDLVRTYRAIQNGYGYCADFVRVFLALAHAAGLQARQWGFSFDNFGGHGHTFVEVFDRQMQRWLLLDVFNNFHVVDATTGEPLGALEYRESLLGRRAAAVMLPNGPGRPGFVHGHKALDYYRRGIHQWYLLWGNAVPSYYMHPAVKITAVFSGTLANLAANVVGVQPRIRIYETPENIFQVRRMFALQRRLRWTGILLAALVVTLGVQLALTQSGHSSA